MKWIFNFVLWVTLLIFFACSSFPQSHPNYEKIADKITAKTAEQLREEKGLILCGTGGGMMQDIQMMMMGFNFYDLVDVAIARELLVYSVTQYLHEINGSKKVQPYLTNYPFTNENIEIVIYFYDPNGSVVPPGKLKIASAKEGEIVYYIDDPKGHGLQVIYRETYKTAQQVIQEQK